MKKILLFSMIIVSLTFSSACVEWHRKAFVPVAYVDGDLGGLLGADAFCATKAEWFGLGTDEYWLAWLSTSDTNAADRVFWDSADDHIPIQNAAGGTVATSKADFLSGTLSDCIRSISSCPLSTPPYCSSTAEVWTGTSGDGTYANSGDCDQWTSDSGCEEAAVGKPADWFLRFGEWTDSDTRKCNEPLMLICISEPTMNPW